MGIQEVQHVILRIQIITYKVGFLNVPKKLLYLFWIKSYRHSRFYIVCVFFYLVLPLDFYRDFAPSGGRKGQTLRIFLDLLYIISNYSTATHQSI